MRLCKRHTRRRGATLLEAAIIIPVFLLFVLGTVDVGLAVLRYNILSQGARQGARTAMVHGENATSGWNGGRRGTTTIPALMSPAQANLAKN